MADDFAMYAIASLSNRLPLLDPLNFNLRAEFNERPINYD